MERKSLSEMDFRLALENVLHGMETEGPAGPAVKRVMSYEAAGLLTSNEGLVVIMEDDSEFQLQIVRSR
jgi:hypothetical protein